MTMMKQLIIGLLSCFLLFNTVMAQEKYPTIKDIENQLKNLETKHKKWVKLEKIAESPGKNPVYAVSVGHGEFKPGIALVAGIDGRHPAGVYLSLKMLESFLANQESLLENYALYVIPLVNPDAYAQQFEALKYERQGNAKSTDEDRDGRIDEDGYDDLDKDGIITHVRILDPTGDMIALKEDSRILVPNKKRELGQMIYRLISEGVDNDKDGKFNEDGPGGVHLYKNFPFQYPAFSHGAGEHAMSEAENRAVADFLFDRWNIHTVISFGLENNLSEPDKFDKSKVAKRVITGPLEKDGQVNEKMSDTYKKVKGTANAPSMGAQAGSFSTWAYFHYGRYSYVTPGWWAPVLEVKQDSTQTASDAKPAAGRGVPGGKSKEEASYDLRYVKWADSMGIKDYFVDWKKFDHPDFPGMDAEVGGFKPFVRHNPPVNYLDSTAIAHADFLTGLYSNMPKIEFQGVKVDKIDNELYRITGKLVNIGMLPTHSELGDRTRWVRKIRNRIILNTNQEVVLGPNRTFHNALQPGESIDINWLVKGKGKVELEVGSPMIGLKQYSLDLK
jgi:hypothetical protein